MTPSEQAQLYEVSQRGQSWVSPGSVLVFDTDPPRSTEWSVLENQNGDADSVIAEPADVECHFQFWRTLLAGWIKRRTPETQSSRIEMSARSQSLRGFGGTLGFFSRLSKDLRHGPARETRSSTRIAAPPLRFEFPAGFSIFHFPFSIFHCPLPRLDLPGIHYVGALPGPARQRSL